jgi:hypothetical protein
MIFSCDIAKINPYKIEIIEHIIVLNILHPLFKPNEQRCY